MIYPKNFEQKIGFDSVRKLIENKCISTLGVGHCDAMKFSKDYGYVKGLLNQTNEFLAIIKNGVEFPLNYYFDLIPTLNNIRAEGTYISNSELYNLRRSLVTINEVVSFFRVKEEDETQMYPALSELTKELITFPQLVKDIDQILDKFGNIKDNASPELYNIRRQIATTTSSINGMMRRIMNSARESGIVEKDAAPSIRDGRLVIPVAPMNKRKIRGIVHDESATGKTVFIEPAELVEANNQIRKLENEMRREVILSLINVPITIRTHMD